MQDSSNPAANTDSVAAAFRAGAADVGEVMAYLASGVQPDPDTVSRLLLTLRLLKNFLSDMADRPLPNTNLPVIPTTREVA